MKITLSKSQWESLNKKSSRIPDQITVQDQGFGKGPIIMLRGKWIFDAAEFTPSDKLNVLVEKGRITLTLDNPAPQETREYYQKEFAPKPKPKPIEPPLKDGQYVYPAPQKKSTPI